MLLQSLCRRRHLAWLALFFSLCLAVITLVGHGHNRMSGQKSSPAGQLDHLVHENQWHTVGAKPGPFGHNLRRSRWLVVSLKHPAQTPENYLSFLDKLKGWVPLLVGSAASSHHGCKSCMTITKTQNDPESSSDGRTDLHRAFIHAIRHGAREIYMMTSLHLVSEAMSRMMFYQKRGLLYTGDNTFNPCSHFVQPLFGTNRSFSNCFDRNWVYSYMAGDFPPTPILATCDDCGRKSNLFPSGRVQCDASAPNVVVQSGAYARTTLGNSLWAYESFWALFLYILQDLDSHAESDSLILSYITQRLLQETKKSIGFVRSHNLITPAFENDTSVVDDVKDRFCQLGVQSFRIHQFQKYLRGWMCPHHLGVFECVKKLFYELSESNYFSHRQLDSVERFLSDLVVTSYTQPRRMFSEQVLISSLVGSRVKNIYSWPSPEYRVWSEHPFRSMCGQLGGQLGSLNSNKSPVHPAQHKHGGQVGVTTFQRAVISDIILVIVFKVSDAATQIQMAQYFDFMYGRHFKTIFYCTSGTDMIQLFAKMYPQPMNVIDLKTSDSRLFPYVCVSEVMKMHHHVTGYLQLSSDALLNPWTVVRMLNSSDSPWLSRHVFPARLGQTEIWSPHGGFLTWQEWYDVTWGKVAINATLHDLDFISKTIIKHLSVVERNRTLDVRMVQYLQKYNTIAKRFLGHFKRELGFHQAKVYYGNTAIFYVPAKMRESYMVLADQFYRFSVHADLAVPTILYGLARSPADVVLINGSVTWSSHTSILLSSYSPDHVFLYLWQQYMMAAPDRARFMCQRYLTYLESSLAGNKYST